MSSSPKSSASVTSTGGAERAVMKFWVDQLPKIAFVIALILGAGMSYVTPAEKALRISKSDGPRFAFALPPGTNALELRNTEPAEPSSIECDHV